MGITILETMKLDICKSFRLISGINGLENPVDKVGILDWEFFKREKGQFVHGEFVLTSLLFAKDHPEYIYDAVKDLIEDGASGLAIKNIYYDAMPAEVVEMSNDHKFPIFIFDNSAYFEDIITEVNDCIRIQSDSELIEAKLSLMIEKALDPRTVKEISSEINPFFDEDLEFLYLSSESYVSEGNLKKWQQKFKAEKWLHKQYSLLKYRQGLFLIGNNLEAVLETVVLRLGKAFEGRIVGKSDGNQAFNIGLKQAYYSYRYAIMTEQNEVHFKQLGLFQFILPHQNDYWLNWFSDHTLAPLIQHDEKYQSELMTTAVTYIDKGGDLKQTAEALFLHINTVRYRMSKISELIGDALSEYDLYATLLMAIKSRG